MRASWLTDEIDKSFVAPWHGAVERAVFGGLDTSGIVAALDDGCRAAFGSGLHDGFLYHVSVGCVIGCRLEDGREIVLKAHQRRWHTDFLLAVKRVQSYLYAEGFACPEPVGEPMTIAGATVFAERALPDPGIGPPTSDLLAVSAAGLALVVHLCRDRDEPDLAAHPLRAPDGDLFPEPHSPLFDFDATSAGAEWIDELAGRAATIRDADTSEPVIAHTDWSLRNVRLDGNGPIAVYDWDSLALLPESHAVGGAAATWCKTGEPDDVTPTAAEVDDYIDAYETARGAPFSRVQRRATRAAALWVMAYTARCEHSLDPHGEVWTTTRPRLRAEGDALLG